MSDSSSIRGCRLWFPTCVAILGGVGLLIIRIQADLERNFQEWFSAGVLVLAFFLVLIWFLLFSRVAWRIRGIAFALLLLMAFALTKMLRVDGTVDGRGLPKLVWRWIPRSDAAIEHPTVESSSDPAPLMEGLRDVPQFFGPDRDGVVRDAQLAPDWFASPPKELWRRSLGAGWSAFAVVGGRAYTQEQRGEEEMITCYEVATGRLLWAHANPVHFQQWQGGDGPRATPTVHEGNVFAIGATGILDCLDAGTGRLIWSRDVLLENKAENLIWGVSASPLVFGDTVVVTGGLTGPTVLAYGRSDGCPLWTSGTDKASYASPILADLAGHRVILSVNAASLTAHDPATGEILLNYPWSDASMPKASQPVVIGSDQVFLSSGYGVGCVLLQVTSGNDGKLVATQVWKSLKMKTQFNSVAVRDGCIYGLDDGLLACVDLANGKRLWKEGRFGSGQTLLVDDLIIVQGEPGEVVLAYARSDGFKELGRIPALSAKTWNHPTLAGRYLLLRNSEEMVCYELPILKVGTTELR